MQLWHTERQVWTRLQDAKLSSSSESISSWILCCFALIGGSPAYVAAKPHGPSAPALSKYVHVKAQDCWPALSRQHV